MEISGISPIKFVKQNKFITLAVVVTIALATFAILAGTYKVINYFKDQPLTRSDFHQKLDEYIKNIGKARSLKQAGVPTKFTEGFHPFWTQRRACNFIFDALEKSKNPATSFNEEDLKAALFGTEDGAMSETLLQMIDNIQSAGIFLEDLDYAQDGELDWLKEIAKQVDMTEPCYQKGQKMTSPLLYAMEQGSTKAFKAILKGMLKNDPDKIKDKLIEKYSEQFENIDGSLRELLISYRSLDKAHQDAFDEILRGFHYLP